MSDPVNTAKLLDRLKDLDAPQLRRLLVEHLTKRKLGLYWESDAIARDAALNADLVLPRLVPELSHRPDAMAEGAPHRNLVIEGDNFDALRLLKSTHAGRIRVIYIDPPYNTGNKDWVYNDRFVGANDRWRHSQWLEFLYRRLTLARDLLTPDGVILVSINDENRSRLELLMNEVFPGRRLGTLVWRTRQGSNADQDCFLSMDHEHVLAYGNEAFRFSGFAKSYEMYANPDDDERGDWRLGDITLGFSHKERPNLYYPLIDPQTGIAYPANPDSIWRFATRHRVNAGQSLQARPMEEYLELGQIVFPANPRTEVWPTKEDLLAAIQSGDVPSSGKKPLLRRDLPDLDFWVGRRVGFGRPQFKRYKADLRNPTQPLSSWIASTVDDESVDGDQHLVSGTNQEGSRDISALFGGRRFNYAKPPSLVRNLLSQSARPGDIVLDFFAGSGTTGQAVLELNAEDGGQRRYILCSSTEATTKTPDKNLCRDVCAERMRRVNSGYGGKPGYSPEQGGEFAYFELDRIPLADVPFETDAAHAFQLLALRLTQSALPVSEACIQRIAQAGDCDVLLCADVDAASIAELAAWPQQHGVARIAVYSPRPASLREALEAHCIDATCYSLQDALRSGQAGATA